VLSEEVVVSQTSVQAGFGPSPMDFTKTLSSGIGRQHAISLIVSDRRLDCANDHVVVLCVQRFRTPIFNHNLWSLLLEAIVQVILDSMSESMGKPWIESSVAEILVNHAHELPSPAQLQGRAQIVKVSLT
jgi:hypothetical protein